MWFATVLHRSRFGRFQFVQFVFGSQVGLAVRFHQDGSTGSVPRVRSQDLGMMVYMGITYQCAVVVSLLDLCVGSVLPLYRWRLVTSAQTGVWTPICRSYAIAYHLHGQ